MKRKRFNINAGINSFLFATIGEYLKRTYHLSSDTLDIVDRIPPPFMVIAHHVSSFDAFFISALIGKPVQYLASDSIFRNPLMKFLLSLVGAIPKTKFRPDQSIIRTLVDIKNRNGIIGVFPEGQSTWDGVQLPFLLSTGKLVKLIGVPVIAAKIHGAYHIRPRWSRTKRKGSASIDFSLLISPEEIGSLKTTEINERIAHALEYNVWDHQRTANRSFSGTHLAEHIERVLYACPECEQIGTLRSAGVSLSCTTCGMKLNVNRKGFFEPASDSVKLFFSDICKWNLWQNKLLCSRMDNGLTLSDSDVLLKTGHRMQPLRRTGKGSLLLDGDILTFTMPRTVLSVPLAAIESINIQTKERLEFYYDTVLYHFQFPTSVSAYKWLTAIQYVQGMKGYIKKGVFYGEQNE